MSAPKPAVVIVILLLVAIVALFIVFVGVGAVDRQPEPDWTGLKNRFTTASPVTLEEMDRSACPQFKELPPGESCVIKVKPSDRFLRKLTLATDDQLGIQFRPDPDAKPIQIRLKPQGSKDPLSLTIRSKGAVLELSCLGFAAGGVRRGCIIR